MPRPTALITTAAGAPNLCALSIRESQSVPGRLKVGLIADAQDGVAVRDPEGTLHPQKLPKGAKGLEVCAEWRIDLN